MSPFIPLSSCKASPGYFVAPGSPGSTAKAPGLTTSPAHGTSSCLTLQVSQGSCSPSARCRCCGSTQQAWEEIRSLVLEGILLPSGQISSITLVFLTAPPCLNTLPAWSVRLCSLMYYFFQRCHPQPQTRCSAALRRSCHTPQHHPPHHPEE